MDALQAVHAVQIKKAKLQHVACVMYIALSGAQSIAQHNAFLAAPSATSQRPLDHLCT